MWSGVSYKARVFSSLIFVVICVNLWIFSPKSPYIVRVHSASKQHMTSSHKTTDTKSEFYLNLRQLSSSNVDEPPKPAGGNESQPNQSQAEVQEPVKDAATKGD